VANEVDRAEGPGPERSDDLVSSRDELARAGPGRLGPQEIVLAEEASGEDPLGKIVVRLHEMHPDEP